MRLDNILLSDIDMAERARKEYKGIQELADSIREEELIMPIAVYDRASNGEYTEERFELLGGGRRMKACQLLEMESIPARIYDEHLEEMDMLAIELAENIYREDLTWQESVELKEKIHKRQMDIHGKAISRRTDKIGGVEKGWSLNRTARLLGESAGGLSQDIALAGLIKEVPEIANIKHKSDALKLIKGAGVSVRRKTKAREVEKEIETQQDKLKGDLVNRFIVLPVRDNDLSKSGFFEGVKDIPDNSVDLVEIDPPYGIELDKKRKSEGLNVKMSSYNEVPSHKYEAFMSKTIKEAKRILSPTGWLILWFGPEPWFDPIYKLLKNNGLQTRRIPGIWTKGRGQTMQPRYYLANTYEMFYYAHKGEASIVKQGRSNEFEFPGVPSRGEGHPTPRPIELMQEIIETFCEPGGLGVIPFLGSGSTLLAMANVGMRGIGWELTAGYKDDYIIEVDSGRIGEYKSYG